MQKFKPIMDKVFRLKAEDLQKYISMYFKSIQRPFVQTDGFIYSKGSIPLMLVAHMDTVHREQPTICKSDDEKIWMAPEGIGGDDRSGIWIILEIMKKHDVHVLFTQGEEVGCVGATDFTTCGIYPEINFMVEVDRKGDDDAVFYDCGNEEFKDFIIETTGYVESYGSFSDISVLAPHLNRAAVNLSSGYYNPHTNYEYINLDDMKNTRKAIESIIEEMNWDKVYNYQKKYKTYSGYGKSGIRTNASVSGAYSYYDDYYDDYDDGYGNVWKYDNVNKQWGKDATTKASVTKKITDGSADKQVSSFIDSSVEMPDDGMDEWDYLLEDEVGLMLYGIFKGDTDKSLVSDIASLVKMALCDYGYL